MNSFVCLSSTRQQVNPLLGSYLYTVEPPNKGHFGSKAFVLFSEVVLWWEVRANMQFIAPSRPNIAYTKA